MYLIDKQKELTPELLQKYINNFVLNKQPTLKKWENCYNGRYAILNKSYADITKPCNRIVTNFCKVIVDTYNGYITGKPISYSSNQDISDVQQILNYNDVATEDNELLKDALIYGISYELQYLDEDAQQRFTRINPLNAFVIYSNTLNRDLLYFVRWYPANEIENNNKYVCEVYTQNSIITYEMENQLGTLLYVKEEPHYYKQCPVSVFQLNENETNIFDCIISLNDAYNELQSSELDDYQAFVDAYLCLTDVDLESEDITKMKENRVLLLPNGSTANYLTKQINDAQIKNMLDNIKKNIYKITNCPDMSDEAFLAQSGVALQWKIVGFENSASNIVASMTKALQRRIELICEILNLKAAEATWRDINITFTRNLPNDYATVIQLVNSLQGIISNKTLLSLLPFIKDVDAELEAVNKQKQENMDLYGLGNNE